MTRLSVLSVMAGCICLAGCVSVSSNNVSDALSPQQDKNLAMQYLEGSGATYDPAKAAALLDKAAEPQKYADRSFLADLFSGQSSSVAGDPEAQTELGLLYQEGQGVDQDTSKAKDLYTQAAFTGDPAAQASLGMLYEKGIGVAKDPVTAYAWFWIAADQKNDDGQLGIDRLKAVLTADQMLAAKRLHDTFAASIH